MRGVNDEVTFLTSRDYIDALQEQLTTSGLASNTRILQDSGEERERYGFDLASVACLATIFVAGVITTEVGLALTRAYKKVRAPLWKSRPRAVTSVSILTEKMKRRLPKPCRL